MKILLLLSLVLLLSCNNASKPTFEDKKELSVAQTEDEKTFEFAYEKAHFNGGTGSGVDVLNTIEGFDAYFKLENNVVIRKDTSTPFTGKIILYSHFDEFEKYEGMGTEIREVRELDFTNGFLFQLEDTDYRPNGTISTKIKYNAFSFFDDEKRMKYSFDILESYTYFDVRLTDDNTYDYNMRVPYGNYVNNLIRSSVAGPDGLYKTTRYKTTGEIEEEGYSQTVTVPQYYAANEHYGNEEEIGWNWKTSRVGIWKHYFDNGEKYYERMWGLKNAIIYDIETYRFSEY